ncbi:tripartite tricarboxylate transporter substrate binding protein [Dehalobacterium formicoaceticum]|uniref:tripartite tricarboxylate transporter substrate binding protein n=1 Tax=Dehalobacterium formicoaceticum TaxID=51515 RepID=UPI000B7F97B3|nr:tripartite tricarboxylate transporter substrate binding protein [Dehalobacterium formicoaceticum]
MKKWVKLAAAIVSVSALLLTGCGGNQKTPGGEAVNFPDKPVNMIIAFTAGGSSDVQARIIDKYWKQEFKDQPLTFDYQVGAGGQVGFTAITKAKTDGYTIGGINVPHINLQALSPQATYKIEDFAFICQVVKDPNLLVVQANSPMNSVADFVAEAKKKDGKMTIGVVGTFTAHHIAALQLMDLLGIELTLVPFTGAADENVALMGGHVDAMIGNLNDVMRDVSKYKFLAIASEERHPWLKDVPTFKEQNVEFVSDIRRGFAAPKDIDPAVLQVLRDGFEKICTNPDYLADMEQIGQPADYLNGEEFAEVVNTYTEQVKPLVEKYGLDKSN